MNLKFLGNKKDLVNPNYDMSIKKCKAIQMVSVTLCIEYEAMSCDP